MTSPRCLFSQMVCFTAITLKTKQHLIPPVEHLLKLLFLSQTGKVWLHVRLDPAEEELEVVWFLSEDPLSSVCLPVTQKPIPAKIDFKSFSHFLTCKRSKRGRRFAGAPIFFPFFFFYRETSQHPQHLKGRGTLISLKSDSDMDINIVTSI